MVKQASSIRANSGVLEAGEEREREGEEKRHVTDVNCNARDGNIWRVREQTSLPKLDQGWLSSYPLL